ncbi:MAG: AI-2E family transporter [Terriglobia bacterium]|jgi:predicted PurR-regulated permease PerM
MQRTDYGRIALLIVLVIVLYYVFRILEPFLPALAWAAILATVFHPLFSALSRRLRHPRWASAVSCVLLTVVIVLPAMFLLFMLAEQSVGAYRMLEARVAVGGPASFETVRKTSSYQWFLARTKRVGMPEPDLGAVAAKVIGIVSEFLVSRSASIFSGITHFVVNFFVMIFALYYLLLRGPGILHELRQLSPLRPEHEEKIIEKFRAITRATLGGSLATALIHGTAGGVIFFFFGLPSPLLWGAVMAVLSLVPVVGTALVWAPVVVYYVLTGAVWKGIILLVVFVGVVGTVDNLVKPVLIRRGTEIDTFWIFLSVLGGIGVFGFLGLFLGPFLLTLCLVLVEIYKVEFRDELRGDAAS